MSIFELMGEGDAAAFTRDLLVKMGEAAPDLIYAKDTKSRMIFANRAVLAVLGKSWEEIRGKSDDEWHSDPEEGRKFVEADARVMQGGEPESLEETLTGTDGPQIYLSTKAPLTAQDGTVIGLFGISMNITERKNAEKMRQILINELDHRLNNTLALVQAMARQTFKNVAIDEMVWDAFEGRLKSMAKAHSLLARQSWVGADISDVVADGLMAHGGDKADCFAISGPSAWIDAQTALSLAMVFHELGTNAVKYGALSVPQGKVAISWTIGQNGEANKLDLTWKESGGPAVSAPTHVGFGSKLVQLAFGHGGTDGAKVDYQPDGIEFRTRFDLTDRLAK